jgi:hypothetical protein
MSEGRFDPAPHLIRLPGRGGKGPTDYLPVAEKVDRRTLPKSPEHRAKISAALKRYAARPDAHQRNMPRGADAPNWKGGVKNDVYRRIGFAAHGDRCTECGAPADHIHHRDRNRYNSEPANLQPLCQTCHNRPHFGRRVAWDCPACGHTPHLQPAQARRRKFCSPACKETSRKANGRYG